MQCEEGEGGEEIFEFKVFKNMKLGTDLAKKDGNRGEKVGDKTGGMHAINHNPSQTGGRGNNVWNPNCLMLI